MKRILLAFFSLCQLSVFANDDYQIARTYFDSSEVFLETKQYQKLAASYSSSAYLINDRGSRVVTGEADILKYWTNFENTPVSNWQIEIFSVSRNLEDIKNACYWKTMRFGIPSWEHLDINTEDVIYVLGKSTILYRSLSPGRVDFLVMLKKIDGEYKTILDSYCSTNHYSDVISIYGKEKPGTEPVIFAPGVISHSGRYEHGLSISPDGKKMVYGERTEDRSDNWLYLIDITGEVCKTAELAPFLEADQNAEMVPCFAPDVDDNKLYYVSFGTNDFSWTGNADIYVTQTNDSVWESPEKLPGAINNSGGQFEVSAANNGVLYFGSNQGSNHKGKTDVYRAEPNGDTYTVSNLGSTINTSSCDDVPCIAPDESFLIFGSDRSGGYGGWDLYISFKGENNQWQSPINLGEGINTSGTEIYPSLSPDGKYLFFTRRLSKASDSESDIYWMSTSVLEQYREPTEIKNPVNEKGLAYYDSVSKCIRIENIENYPGAIYRIVNLSGQVILNGTLKGTEIDVSKIDNGIYFVQFHDGQQTWGSQFIIQN